MKKNYAEIEENEVVKMAQEHDDDAITYLMENYKGLVRQKTRPLFLMGGDKDDLIQEGMIGLYKAICDFDVHKDTSFKTFADLCISRQVYTAIKNSNRMKNMPLNTYISIYAPAAGEENSGDFDFMLDRELEFQGQNPEDIVIGRESANMIERKLFDVLSKMEKEVLQYYLEGVTYQEIALIMNRNPKSIDNALQRIRSKLSKQQKTLEK